jgi:gliding motility-associated-like protein
LSLEICIKKNLILNETTNFSKLRYYYAMKNIINHTIKFIFLTLLLTLLSVQTFSQLVVNTGNTAAWYVQNVLLGGGVTVSNITFTAPDPNQIGEFNSLSANVGINQGVIMATGDVNVAVGPNNTGGATLGGGGFTPSSDPDLSTIAGVTIYDAAILEFDFVPQGDTVRFNYVFASEEYMEFVNSGYNDAFGFFLSGPGITGPFSNGAENIALIPGTTTPVTIDNVNLFTNSAYYIDNGDGLTAPYNSNPQYIQFDGKTVRLTAEYPVTCGLTYHIKIAIADAGDGSFDSGVFLEAGSFSSNLINLSSNIGVSTGDSVLYEGCGVAQFLMTRNIASDSEYVDIVMGGVAINGVDYTNVPDSVLFLPGEDSLLITINAFTDGFAEPLETVSFILIQNVCNTPDTQTVTFYIADFTPPPLIVHDTTFTACVNDSVPVWIDPVPDNFNVLWSTGETSDTIWVKPNATTYYTVTVFDTCNVYFLIDSALVTYYSQNPLTINVSPDQYKICPQDSFQLTVTAITGAGGYQYQWNTGQTDSSIIVSPPLTTDYIITVTDICNQVATDTITVTVAPYTPLSLTMLNNDTNICWGESVTLSGTANGGAIPIQYNWNNGQSITPTIFDVPNDTTTYVLTVSDRCQFVVQDSITVNVWKATSPLTVFVQNDTIFCVNDSATLNAIVTGGVFGKHIVWNTGDTTSSITVKPSNTSLYSVFVTDTCGNTANTVASVVVVTYPPVTLSVSNDTTIKCPGDSVEIYANYNGGSSNQKYLYWYDGTNTYYGNPLIVNPYSTQTFTAFVIDSCAMDSAMAMVTVNVPQLDPLQVIVNDTLICVGDVAQLKANASGGLPPYSYLWSNGSLGNTISVSPSTYTNYTITVTDDCQSQASDVATVDTQQPTAEFGYNFLSDVTVQFLDSSYLNIVGWHWTFSAVDTSLQQNPIYSFEVQGSHEVMLVVTDNIGCKDTLIKIIQPPLIIYAPNAFTPDNDGVNDIFTIKGIGIEQATLYIFNRWGELLFETNDLSAGWNGIYQGKPVEQGVYVWKVVISGYNNDEIEKIGSVNVIR